MATIHVKFPLGHEGGRYVNSTGAALVKNEFVVLGGKCLKACEAIADGAVGGFEKLRDKIISASTFVSGEATFATANLAVYWKPSTGEFSNTSTTGYYLIGYGVAAIASGVIDVEVCTPVLK